MLGNLSSRRRSGGSADPRPRTEAGSPLGLEPAALLALALLSGIWAWWGWQKGAYFGTVMLPGLVFMCIGLILLIRFAPWRIRLRLSTPVVVALAGLVALGCWALLSALWSPAPDIAIANGQRMLGYAIAFGLGILLCNLLGERMKLALVPLAFAGGVVGLITAFYLLTGNDPRALLEDDGTLQYPLLYRNADAAFFAICFFPALSLAVDRDLDRRLRVAGLTVATLCLDLAILAQSRASVPAILVALVVFVIASPYRVRAISWLGLAALAAIPTVPAMSSLFTASADGIADVAGEMHTAGLVVLLTTAAAAVLALLAIRNEDRLPGLGSNTTAGNRSVIRAMGGVGIALVLGFIVLTGNPFSWVGDRIDEFKSGGTPDLTANGTRFGFNAGSNRYDAWRVALSDFGDDPLFGDGGGGYRYSYLIKRDTSFQKLNDAHSVEFEILSEYGLVGISLFLAAIGGAFVGAIKARPLGPSARILSAGALATGAYWIVHGSLDWLWPYPVIAAPVLALLGSAAAPALRTVRRRSTRPWRLVPITGLIVLALSAVAPFLADSYVTAVVENDWRTDPQRAISDLDRAHDFNRFDDFPLLLKGRIQAETGDIDGALESYREAVELRPEEFATHYLIAQLEAVENRSLARNEIRVALELNPLDRKVRQLATQLGIPESQLAPLPEAEQG